MKQRKPKRPRNLLLKAMYETNLFSHKIVPPKKGKGTSYKRKRIENIFDPFVYLRLVMV